jgi:penicillin-binding protein 1C
MARWRWVVLGPLVLCAAVLVAAWFSPLPIRLVEPPSTVVGWSDGTIAHVFLAPDDRWRLPTDLDDVDPAYVDALVRFEDKRFWWHPGVDPIALLRAVYVDLRAGRAEAGASTLTLQLVRVLEPRPRTIPSKLVEMFRALTIELRMSKREILAAYLTFAPYGGNVEGVRAASWSYFGHDADHLTAAEIATLLAVPQNPGLRAPSTRHADALRSGRDEIARRLADFGALPVPEDSDRELVLAQVIAAPVPESIQLFPREIPHLAVWLHERDPAAVWIPTTIDRAVQHRAEQALASVEEERALQGVHNAVVMVVDHHTGDVAAVVGGFSFWDDAHGGQIAAFDNPRSPGSALKPVIYALSIDTGQALPEFLVPDVPLAFGSYAPENYDGTFSGLVALQDALSRSLNLPFVYLLEKIGVEPFLGTLRVLGAGHLVDKPGWYGLSAAIGGLELTPAEMAGIYATFAEGGEYRPLRYRSDAPTESPLRVFSPGASWLARRALTIRDRPDFPARWKVSAAPRNIAWKTGTSYGHHDAWAAGWGDRYAAVVWMGNVDNRPSNDLLGAYAAGPVLFDVLEGLGANEPPPPRPDDLVEIRACSYSGHVAGDACPDTKVILAPKTHVPTEPCPYHVQRDVDVATGLAITPACRAGRTWETRTFVVWPASVRRFLADSHHVLPEPPSWAPGCSPSASADDLAVASPADGQVVVLIPGLPAQEQEVPFAADATHPDAHLTWFVDGARVGSGTPEARVWWTPVIGRHEVVVVDDDGALARRWLEVKDKP